jgi:hypothetical protein
MLPLSHDIRAAMIQRMKTSTFISVARSLLDRRVRTHVLQSLKNAAFRVRAESFAGGNHELEQWFGSSPVAKQDSFSDLRSLFEANVEGPGIWKWLHYLPAYERHLGRYRGKRPVVAEIGVFSGGSLKMWRDWFGPGSQIHGIDIDPACRSYESLGVSIHIGDQANPLFWQEFRKRVPQLDVLIDDGGHLPDQQVVTLEQVLPHLAPGGTIVIEDIHGDGNPFSSYISGLLTKLNQAMYEQGGGVRPGVLQSAVEEVALLPFMLVIRKREAPLQSMVAERRGTEWQPAVVRDARGSVIHGRGA